MIQEGSLLSSTQPKPKRLPQQNINPLPLIPSHPHLTHPPLISPLINIRKRVNRAQRRAESVFQFLFSRFRVYRSVCCRGR